MNNTQRHIETQTRELNTVLKGQATADGAGVRLTRYIGSPELNYLDPFLLFDVFESDQSDDYIGGFPNHPHRGFETVTYLLNGKMRHRDNAGHEGVIESGGVQWMTAGKGIVHSEHPEQEEGLLHGFQLWVNLPAANKMTEPGYQEFSQSEIPHQEMLNSSTRVIAGHLNGLQGPVQNTYVQPTFADISLMNGQSFQAEIDSAQSVFVYVIAGEIVIGTHQRKLSARQLGVLSPGAEMVISPSSDARFLLLAADPLQEPIARGGPFVMNTKAEILQAFDDFENNRL